MRTPQKALTDALPAIQAAAEGKEVEYRRIDEPEAWCFACQPTLWKLKDFANPSLLWRPKPEPKRTLRPWKPEEVPVGVLIKSKSTYWKGVLIQFDEQDRIAVGEDRLMTRRACLENYEHSTDGGKTWHPCGVWEEEA